MDVPLKDLPSPFKWIIGVVFVVALLFVAIRYSHEARKAGIEADSAAEELKKNKATNQPAGGTTAGQVKVPSELANGPSVAQPNTPAAGKKEAAKDGSIAAIPPARKLKRVPAEVSQPNPAVSGGFQAQLESSLLEGDELVCTALVTKIGSGAQRTMKFQYGGGPSLTLPDGTRMKHTHVEIGGRAVITTNVLGDVQFEKDVPVKIVMRFRPVPTSTTKLAHLDLGFYGKFDLTFRDAPVQRLVAE